MTQLLPEDFMPATNQVSSIVQVRHRDQHGNLDRRPRRHRR